VTDTDTTLGEEPLVIVELRASNMMRLNAVNIRPDPDDNVIIIAGDNSAGKSSVLNSIGLALGGAAAAKGVPVPIRHGEDDAEVTIDLGRFVVRRTYNAAKRSSSLVVTTADGHRFASPQTFLDEFLGDLTFDPLAFMRLPAKDQLATLLPLVDLPFDLTELDAERAIHYAERTLIGRERDSLTAQAEAAPVPEPNTATNEVSTEALLVEHSAAREVAANVASIQALADRALDEASRAEQQVVDYDSIIERLRAELAATEQARSSTIASISEYTEAAAAHQRAAAAIKVPDLADIEQRLAEVEATNTTIRAAAEHRRLWEKAHAKRDEYDGLSLLIAEIDGRKTAAIRDATMPITGLGFDDKQVSFNDVPLSQCSGAEQLRVSMAIGLAANPTIRVLCVKDAAILDANSMRLVREFAAEHHAQIWLEVISPDDPAAIIIEDGGVAESQTKGDQT
jgi:hypothetical protein